MNENDVVLISGFDDLFDLVKFPLPQALKLVEASDGILFVVEIK